MGELAGGIRALQPPPLLNRMPADRSVAAEFGSESEVEGVATVFAVSSAMDGRGTQPGMAESSGKDSSHSLDLALILESIQTEAQPYCAKALFSSDKPATMCGAENDR
ncbi:MAG: hypothetical protein DHS20C12_19780 [Pseudohongiella sp.]|nr:MAG: hypothetical protein DHS20C12_19780 [Pseudohongiella sp.]